VVQPRADSLPQPPRLAPPAARSLVEHSQCRPAVSRFQSQKQRARILDVSLGTTLGGRLQGNRSRMIWTADENQGFGQAPYGCAVKRCFFHSKCPRVVVYAGLRSSSPSSNYFEAQPSSSVTVS